MRTPLLLVVVAGMLSGCPRSSDGSRSEPQALDACLTKWWRTYFGACNIMPECSDATGELQQACAAEDCRWMVFIGYRDDGADIEGHAIWSATQSLLCASNVQVGTWSLVDADHIQVTFGAAPAQTVAATCSGTVAEVNGQSLTALPADVSAALTSRATSGSWTACTY